MFGIDHPVQALFFDRAVWMFGTNVEADMDAAASKAKKARDSQQARTRVLNKWLGTQEQSFRQPTITR